MKSALFLSLFMFAAGARAAGSEAPKPLTKAEAITRAETFVKENAGKPGPHGQDSLDPKAVGARLDSEMWFVGFRSTGPGARIRGVMLAQDGSMIKAVSQSFTADWLAGNDPPPRKAVDREEAGTIAAKFLKDAGASAGAPAKIEERRDPAADPWNSWWVTFENTALKGKKAKTTVIVAVHKETGEAKWVELKAPKAPAPPKAPPAKKKPKR